MNYTFNNASIVSVVNGSIVVKDSTGREHTFTNASIVSVNNGTIIIESEWEPKVGELIKLTGYNTNCYCIYRRSELNRIYDYGHKKIADSTVYTKIDDLPWCTIGVTVSPVTSEEQKEFDDFCRSQGKLWNKETLQWEKYIWKPSYNDIYYYINLSPLDFSIRTHRWVDDNVDNGYYQKNNCFKTKKEAEVKLEQIKQILNQ